MRSEINCAISSFWDNGWDVKLGDEMNGFVAEGNFRTLDECADFLDRQARKYCPESSYALGRMEHDRREIARMKVVGQSNYDTRGDRMMTVMFSSGEQRNYNADSAVLQGDFVVLYVYNRKRRRSESRDTFPAGNVAWARSQNGTITLGRAKVKADV
jgi:hypothetical protein